MSAEVIKVQVHDLPEEIPGDWTVSRRATEVYRRHLPIWRGAPKEIVCQMIDFNTIVSFCETVATKEEAIEAMDKPEEEGGGRVVRNGKIIQASPWLSIRNAMIEQEKKLVQDLGFAPAVRKRIDAPNHHGGRGAGSLGDLLQKRADVPGQMVIV